jgi:hypothetical protein
MFNIGDKVTVLDEAIQGIVLAMNQNKIKIETTDGFELTYESHELIKMGNVDFGFGNQSKTQVLKEKEIPKPRSFVKEKKTKESPVPEFDLHIQKLVKNYRSMSNYEILTLQTETAKRHIEFAMKNKIPKIVFIHGVGEGVLKAELDFMLGRYDNIIFQDANYQKYGQGATEVYFKQNKS